MQFQRRHRECQPRELYYSPDFRKWARDVLPTIQRTAAYATHESPREEVAVILGRFAVGARLIVEPNEDTPGDIKRLHPPENSIWELKTGDMRIFGWFHAHDCFVANTGGDATTIKANRVYDRHIGDALDFLAQSGLKALEGDHHHVLTL